MDVLVRLQQPGYLRRRQTARLRGLAQGSLVALEQVEQNTDDQMVVIGLGAQQPTAEWGAMVSTGRNFILDQWWYSAFPGFAILVTATGFNLLGDGVRDMLDPRQKGR